MHHLEAERQVQRRVKSASNSETTSRVRCNVCSTPHRQRTRWKTKSNPTKNRCSRKYFLVKSFKQHCLLKITKIAKQTKQNFVDLRANVKQRAMLKKIGAAGSIFWLSLAKQNYYTKIKNSSSNKNLKFVRNKIVVYFSYFYLYFSNTINFSFSLELILYYYPKNTLFMHCLLYVN